ncbi:hypothetical protein 2 [Sanxia tombus-like virus 5]|uniref:hypothetical protein 2 n=1 Tax=Sanxia tombus-like virus 5 TaxID=1923389 RepID=UPI00090BAB03|nr:hypothetical protein 2 [Sanxia tombus-like virus 5]APG76413.1 hypothetical protein 2 [Sanxia tombus-like virus 5]
MGSNPIARKVICHQSCVNNEIIGLSNRHIVDRSYIKFDREYFLRMAKATRQELVDAAQSEKVSKLNVVYGYSGGKRAMYLRAADVPFRVAHSSITAFVKVEKGYEEDIHAKAPRMIQYRSPVYNLNLATYLKPLEHALYANLLNENGVPVIAKGKNPRERAEHIKACFDDKPYVLAMDHSKFDSTIRVEHLRAEHKIYNRVFKSKFLSKLLDLQIDNRGYTRNGLKYRVRGTRMSGDFNTGLGNSVINYIVLKSFLTMNNIKGHIYLDGDDSLVFIDPKHRDLDFSHFEKCGFETKREESDCLADVDFCQAKYMESTNLMVRNPVRAISRSLVQVRRSAFFRIRAGEGIGMTRTHPGVPVLYPLYKQMGVDEKPIFLKWYPLIDDREVKITDAARVEFWHLWGISPDEQLALEESRSCGHCGTLHHVEFLCPSYKNAQSVSTTWSGLG